MGFGHRCDEDLRAFGDARGDVRAELPAHARPHLPALRLAMPPPTARGLGLGSGSGQGRVGSGWGSGLAIRTERWFPASISESTGTNAGGGGLDGRNTSSCKRATNSSSSLQASRSATVSERIGRCSSTLGASSISGLTVAASVGTARQPARDRTARGGWYAPATTRRVAASAIQEASGYRGCRRRLGTCRGGKTGT